MGLWSRSVWTLTCDYCSTFLENPSTGYDTWSDDLMMAREAERQGWILNLVPSGYPAPNTGARCNHCLED